MRAALVALPALASIACVAAEGTTVQVSGAPHGRALTLPSAHAYERQRLHPIPKERHSDPDVDFRATSSEGFSAIVQLRNAPFDQHPDVLVHLPPRFDPSGPLHVVLYLHGWSQCVAAMAFERGPCKPGERPRQGLDLLRRFDRANVNALLVVPQLRYLARSSEAGRLSRPGGLRAMLAEIFARPELAPRLGAPRTPERLGRVVIFAHSGGFLPAAHVLERGGIDVHEVHLLDALYHAPPALESWAVTHAIDFLPSSPFPRRLSSIYTTHQGTGSVSRRLFARIARALPSEARAAVIYHHAAPTRPAPEAWSHGLIMVRTAVPHALVPREYLTDLLRSAKLPSTQ